MTFLLPCECGCCVPVTAVMAGMTLPCKCGRTVSVPSLLELRQLPVEESPPDAVDPSPQQTAAVELREFYQHLRQVTPRVWVAPAVIVVNFLVFAAMTVQHGNIDDGSVEAMLLWGANYGPLEFQGEWWRLITSAFLHFGLVHLLMNMACLLGSGPVTERFLGNAGFAVLYFLAAVGGSLASLGWSPNVVSAGASGAICGVNGALIVILLRSRNTIPPAVYQFLLRGPVLLLGFVLLAAFFVKRVDHAGHIGGLVVGLLAGVALYRPAATGPVQSRIRRPVVVLLVGFMALAVAFLPVRARVSEAPDWIMGFAQLERLESEAIAIHNAEYGRVKRGDITELQFAASIERDVLSRWQKASTQIGGWANVPDQIKSLVDKLREYYQAMEKSCELMVRAIRVGDDQAVRQSDAWRKKADRLADELAVEMKKLEK